MKVTYKHKLAWPKQIVGKRRLNVIVNDIKRTAQRLSLKYQPDLLDNKGRIDEWGFFFTKGPNNAIYNTTPPRPLMRFITDLNIPKNSRFADLGAGLGMPSVLFHFYLNNKSQNVTAFEADRDLCLEMAMIFKRHGIKNIRIENRNFLNESLRKYNVLYLYDPFFDDYEKLIPDKLKETNPGTIIITYGSTAKINGTPMWKIIFGNKYFKRLNPKNHNKLNHAFYRAFIRTEFDV